MKILCREFLFFIKSVLNKKKIQMSTHGCVLFIFIHMINKKICIGSDFSIRYTYDLEKNECKIYVHITRFHI